MLFSKKEKIQEKEQGRLPQKLKKKVVKKKRKKLLTSVIKYLL